MIRAPGQISGRVIGAAGSDTLNYQALANSVTVDLAAGMAFRVGGNVFQLENVVGGSGDDVLFGDDANNHLDGGYGNDLLLGRGGDDALYGRSGRDVLIGGLGADRIVAGAGDDLLICGSTTFDNDVDALMEVLSIWGDDELAYDDRVNTLREKALTAATVLDDAAVDILHGERGLDWYWGFLGDRIYQAKGEAVQ